VLSLTLICTENLVALFQGRERFKLILAVEDGPWLVKKAFIKKPMLMLGQILDKVGHG